MKPLYIIMILGIAYLYIGNIGKEEIIIPDDSLRLRIIANSDNEYDQQIKLKVKYRLEEMLTNILKDVKSIEEVETILNNNIDDINDNVKNTLINERYIKNFNVNLGYNYFPEKKYHGVKYKEGMYKSLVVTLGSGKGKNWWCVLFPPLCLVEAEESTEYEYQLFVKEMINKYF